MPDITLTKLWNYPLKSAKGIELSSAAVTPRGLQYDRQWALFDSDGQVITARDYPQLLRLSPNVTTQGLELSLDSTIVLRAPIAEMTAAAVTPVKIFSQPAAGQLSSTVVNEWFSNYLGIECRLMYMPESVRRPLLEKYGGQPGQVVSYADVAPLMMLSTASLADLNSRLDQPVSLQHFRPNVVIDGCAAFEEENCTAVQIGTQRFVVAERCKRCVFTTIDPVTQEKRRDGEPLRTLAGYRRHPRGGVSFGILLVPVGEGTIKTGDEVELVF
ncbi:MAG: MOSC N-terminal beta barrel domain-containing protein [Bacteroidota bacterium]